ncbi:hypothetical protein D3C71_1926680 [compost metagenome]
MNSVGNICIVTGAQPFHQKNHQCGAADPVGIVIPVNADFFAFPQGMADTVDRFRHSFEQKGIMEELGASVQKTPGILRPCPAAYGQEPGYKRMKR